MKSTQIIRAGIKSASPSKLQTHLLAMRPAGGARENRISWLGSLRAGDLMTQPALCVDRQTSLGEARRLMKEHGIRRLPVVDDGRLVGIVTLGDIRGAWPSEVTTLNRFELEYLINQVGVERVMNREVITVMPETRLVDAARLMTDHQISGLPVLSADGQVIGIVTESDIFRALVALIDSDLGLPLDTDDRQHPSDADEELR